MTLFHWTVTNKNNVHAHFFGAFYDDIHFQKRDSKFCNLKPYKASIELRLMRLHL